jgi:GNAT superfamily N-acetyltransferase
MSRSREDLLELVRESMVDTWTLMAESTEGGRALRRDGLVAAIVPATPQRSVSNSVIYTDRDALLGSLEELAGVYADAGIAAWTVWVPEDDAEAGAALAVAGHVLDASPRAMAAELAGAERPDMTGIEWSRECDLETIGRVNDEAYGYDHPGGLRTIISQMPMERLHRYAASVDGQVAAVLMTIDFGTDTEIVWVATREAARGRGLATALMRQAIWDARERGQETSTLQATRLGAPVYARVGYQDLGALNMWERRT